MEWEVKDTIAVLGGACKYTEPQTIAGFQIGREIARCGKNLLTGATLGIPYAAAIGAKFAGGVVVGISPAATPEEHITRYGRPLNFTDVVIYTGMGLEGRNPINVRSAKGAIFIGGEFGTLSEFSAAWTIGNNVLGILDGAGGLSLYIRDVLRHVSSEYGSTVVFDADPIALVHRVCAEVDARYPASHAHAKSKEHGADVRSIVEAFLERERATQQIAVMVP